MKAAIKKLGDVTVISIEGVLEIEHTQPFRQICLQKFLGEKLIFNMHSAAFVGSTGLHSFIETVKSLDASNSYGLKMVGVKPEFRRLLANIETQKLTFFDEVNMAVQSFSAPPPAPVEIQLAELTSELDISVVVTAPVAETQAQPAAAMPMAPAVVENWIPPPKIEA